MNIGVVSTESSHLAAFHAKLGGDVRIVRAFALPGECNEVPAGVELFADWNAFSRDLDGVMLLSRDGRKHPEQFRTMPDLPVFVDKPLACSASDAREILQRERVFSCSMLRWLPEVQALKASQTPIQSIRVPANPASPHAGRWFMGIHGTELACHLLEKPEVRNLHQEGENIIAALEHANGSTELLLDAATSDFIIDTPHETLVLDGPASYGFGLRQVAQFFRTGTSPLLPKAMLEPVQLLEAITKPE